MTHFSELVDIEIDTKTSGEVLHELTNWEEAGRGTNIAVRSPVGTFYGIQAKDGTATIVFCSEDPSGEEAVVFRIEDTAVVKSPDGQSAMLVKALSLIAAEWSPTGDMIYYPGTKVAISVDPSDDGLSVLRNLVDLQKSESRIYLHPLGMVIPAAVNPEMSGSSTTKARVAYYNDAQEPFQITVYGTVGIWFFPKPEAVELPEGAALTDRIGCGPVTQDDVTPDRSGEYEVISDMLAVIVKRAQTDHGVRNLLLSAADEAQADGQGENAKGIPRYL